MLKLRLPVLLAGVVLLSAVSSGLVAQPITPPVVGPRPPVLLVPNDAGISEPVHVQSLDVDVQISGFLAETTLVMTFRNPNDRVVEGQLVFPLPEGATISGFGLDVGGELVDGSVVERQAARVAFETEVRRNIDPGLAEWVQGSTFRTRIYPFPARGNRTVKVSYLSDLTVSGGAATYHLPLAYQEALDRFHFRIAVGQGPAEPRIEAGTPSTLSFETWERQFVAETTLADFTPDEDVVVAVPVDAGHPVLERGDDGSVAFVVQDRLPPLDASAPRPTPSRVAVLFDASASRNDADLERELALLRAWAEAHAAMHVDLVVVRDRLDGVRSFPPGPTRVEDLMDAIREEPLDGGTDLAGLHFPGSLSDLVSGGPVEPVDYYLFLSDGLGSLGEPEGVAPEAPVMAVTSSAGANHAWLRHLAEASGGSYLNLQRLTDEQALAALEAMPLRLVGIEFPPDAIELLQVDSPLPRGGRLVVAGRLLAEEATVTLRYGLGRETAHTSTVVLRRSEATEGALAARYWAQLRIAHLALNADRHREELLRLGQAYNLVTPHTSYLVLETLEQHLEHGIPPAPSRPALLAEYERRATQVRESEAARESAKLERVVAAWRSRVGWWEGAAREPVAIGAEVVPALPETEGEIDWDGIGAAEPDVPSSAVQGSAPAPPRAAGSAGLVDEELGVGFEREEERFSEDSAARTRADTGGEGGVTASGEGGEATIAVQEWSPDTPYLTAMRGVAADQAYGVYLDYIFEHGRSPAFYLDAASYLYQVDRPAEARRVLTNISERGLADARLLRIVAYKLQEEGDLDLAVRLFEEVLVLRPEEPQSRRDLALALADRADAMAAAPQLDDPEAPMRDWARAVDLIDELVRSETGRFESIEMPALMEANRIIARMERHSEAVLGGAPLPPIALDARLRGNLDLDVRVILRWDTDLTDMDLWVTEPSGERCYYANTQTAFGATYGRDYTGGYGPEEYLLRRAPGGNYLVQANYYGSRQQALTGGTTVQADIFTDWGRPTEQRHRGTIRLTTQGETVTIGTVAIGEGAARLTPGEGVRTQ